MKFNNLGVVETFKEIIPGAQKLMEITLRTYCRFRKAMEKRRNYVKKGTTTSKEGYIREKMNFVYYNKEKLNSNVM